jgi:uncharacterized membrane protein YdjX (TVP38/TMEM64 family)
VYRKGVDSGPVIDFLVDLLRWVEGRGFESVLWILLLQTAMVVLCLPGPFFTIAAGFLFGLWGGLAVAVTAATLGSAGAYGIAQAFPRERVLAWSRRKRPLRILERFVREGGWKVVLATRLIPLFPFKFSNYFFGWMRFPFPAFVIGTAVGIIPMTLVSVSVGSLASDMTSALAPGGAMKTGWLVSLVGLLVGVALFLWAGREARRRLRKLGPSAGDDGVTPQPARDAAREAARERTHFPRADSSGSRKNA